MGSDEFDPRLHVATAVAMFGFIRGLNPEEAGAAFRASLPAHRDHYMRGARAILVAQRRLQEEDNKP